MLIVPILLITHDRMLTWTRNYLSSLIEPPILINIGFRIGFFNFLLVVGCHQTFQLHYRYEINESLTYYDQKAIEKDLTLRNLRNSDWTLLITFIPSSMSRQFRAGCCVNGTFHIFWMAILLRNGQKSRDWIICH